MIPTLRATALMLLTCLGLVLLPACGDKAPPPGSSTGEGDEQGHDHGSGPHGGTLLVTGDHALHLEVLHDMAAGRVRVYALDHEQKPLALAEAPAMNLMGEDGSERIQATPDGGSWVFESDLLKGEPTGRFRVKLGDTVYTPPFEHAHDHDEHDGDEHAGHDHDGDEHDGDEHAGHDHDGHDPAEAAHGPHHGILAPWGEGAWLELKLHDDKGDLELWLARDEAMTRPLDLPLDTEVTVEFDAPRKQAVTLRVRNTDRNEDEDDQATVRDGRTHYFIFPGETGADATWLRGKAFEGRVRVRVGDKASAVFDLRPHTH